MLGLDDLLEAAAGDIEPDFELDDIWERSQQKTHRRRATAAIGVCALVVLAIGGSLLAGRAPTGEPTIAVDQIAVDEARVAAAPETESQVQTSEPDAAPRQFMSPETGSAARWHLPAIFDETPLLRSEWPSAIAADPFMRDHVDLFAVDGLTGPHFAALDLEDASICLYLLHPDAGRDGLARACDPTTELVAAPVPGPLDPCCPTFGVLPRSVKRVSLGEGGGPSDWTEVPRGVYDIPIDRWDDDQFDGIGRPKLLFLEVQGGPSEQLGALFFSMGEDGSGSYAQVAGRGFTGASASVTVAGERPPFLLGRDFGYVTSEVLCALHDEAAVANVRFEPQGNVGILHAIELELSTGNSSPHLEVIGELPEGQTRPELHLGPTSRVTPDGRLSIFASFWVDEGLHELRIACGLNYVDARTVGRGQVAGTDSSEPRHLKIDAIDIDVPITSGVGVDDLRPGPGHYPETSLPGRPGNSAIAGPRVTFGAVFHRLDELRPGDGIAVTKGEFTAWYRVTDQGDGIGHKIVDPTNTSILEETPGDQLTLTSSHPKYSSRERIVVIAELISDPLPD